MALRTAPGYPSGWSVPDHGLLDVKKLRSTGESVYVRPYNHEWTSKRKCTRKDVQALKDYCKVKYGPKFVVKIDPGTKCGKGDPAYATWKSKNKDKPQFSLAITV